MKHQDDCVYPQTELWPLCTCPKVHIKPLPQDTNPHDPLCGMHWVVEHLNLSTEEALKLDADWDKHCECALIAKVRADYDDY